MCAIHPIIAVLLRYCNLKCIAIDRCPNSIYSGKLSSTVGTVRHYNTARTVRVMSPSPGYHNILSRLLSDTGFFMIACDAPEEMPCHSPPPPSSPVSSVGLPIVATGVGWPAGRHTIKQHHLPYIFARIITHKCVPSFGINAIGPAIAFRKVHQYTLDCLKLMRL